MGFGSFAVMTVKMSLILYKQPENTGLKHIKENNLLNIQCQQCVIFVERFLKVNFQIISCYDMKKCPKIFTWPELFFCHEFSISLLTLLYLPRDHVWSPFRVNHWPNNDLYPGPMIECKGEVHHRSTRKIWVPMGLQSIFRL